MKIIGKAGERYLVEISEAELANACGFSYAHEVGFRQLRSGGVVGRSDFAIGTEVQLAANFRFIQGLRQREGECANAAATLRALADLITRSVPTAVLDPGEPPNPPPEPQI